MGLYRIYSQEPRENDDQSRVMRLRAQAGDYRRALRMARMIESGIPVPAEFRADDIPGIVAGIPVWVRYRPPRPAVMVTEEKQETVSRNADSEQSLPDVA